MNESPKKIWVDAELDVYDYEEQGTQPYIRADIVDELVEALETDTYTPGCNCDECKRIRDALHKVKEDV